MWTDACVCPDREENLVKMLKVMKRMGYSAIGLGLGCLPSEIDKKGIEERTGVKIYNVYMLEGEDVGKAKSRLRELKVSGLVLGRPRDLEAYRFMSRDSRVTLIEVSPGLMKYIDRGEGELVTRSGGYLGFNLKLIIDRPSNLYTFKAFLSRVYKWSIPFRLFSFAREIFEVWHPKQLYFIAKSLGFPGRLALEGLAPMPSIPNGGEDNV